MEVLGSGGWKENTWALDCIKKIWLLLQLQVFILSEELEKEKKQHLNGII